MCLFSVERHVARRIVDSIPSASTQGIRVYSLLDRLETFLTSYSVARTWPPREAGACSASGRGSAAPSTIPWKLKCL